MQTLLCCSFLRPLAAFSIIIACAFINAAVTSKSPTSSPNVLAATLYDCATEPAPTIVMKLMFFEAARPVRHQ